MPLPRRGGKAEGSTDPGARKLRPPILRPGAWLPRGRLRLNDALIWHRADLRLGYRPAGRPGQRRAAGGWPIRPVPPARRRAGPAGRGVLRGGAPARRPPQLARGPGRGAGQRPAHGGAQRRAVPGRRADVAVHGARRGGRRGPRLPPGRRPRQPRPAGPLPVRHDPAHRGRVRTPRSAPRLRPAPAARTGSGRACPAAPPSASCSTARTRSPGTPPSWTRWPTPSRRPAATRSRCSAARCGPRRRSSTTCCTAWTRSSSRCSPRAGRWPPTRPRAATMTPGTWPRWPPWTSRCCRRCA